MAGEIIQKTAGRLETLHSEGVHVCEAVVFFTKFLFMEFSYNDFSFLLQRLSEMCCFAVTQLLMLGKSIISSVNKAKEDGDGGGDDDDGETLKINWPEDSVEKAKLIRTKAQLMTDNVEAISHSFITGWSSSTYQCFQLSLGL